MDEQRNRWFEALFSTQPSDREAAASAVRAFYEAAELDPLVGIVWLDSPAEACYAAMALCAQHDQLLGRIATALEKMPAQRAEISRIREKVVRSLGETNWSTAASLAGLPLTGMAAPARFDIQGKITLTRIAMWRDPSAALGNLAQDKLFQAQGLFWSVIAGALATLETMLHGSASRRYHLSWMAMDEAAAESGMTAPPLLRAAWTIARSAGPWWPFQKVALMTERPLTVHHTPEWLLERGDGPAVTYRDGWKLFAWNGVRMPEEWIEQPELIPSRQLKQADKRFQEYVRSRCDAGVQPAQKISARPSAILKKDLPQDFPERMEFLRARAGGQLPLYDRYIGGDRQAVWKELIELRGAVRTDPYAADALAVAYETMRRVRENVQMLVARLHRIGYRFSTAQSEWESWKLNVHSALAMNVPVRELGMRSPHVRQALDRMEGAKQLLREQLSQSEKLVRDTNERAHLPPARDANGQIRKLEKKLGTLPLSLRAFYEIVGSVDLIGEHPDITPRGSSISPDPLVVYSIEDALTDSEQMETYDDEGYILIAPDDIHKAGESGGEPYQIAVPDERADGELLNERHGMFFVDYLRLAFHWGGFPGFEGYDRDVPGEISELREGLLEI